MNMRKYLSLVAIISSLLITTVDVSAAQPILPDKFYGTVKLGGADAPAGTQIDIKLSYDYLRSYELESAGMYTLYVAEGSVNDPIEFLIEGMPVGASVRTGGLRENLDLSLSATNSLNQILTSQNNTMYFHGKDVVSVDIEITTKMPVADVSISVSLYENGVLGDFSIGNDRFLKSVTVDIGENIVDYAILKIYYEAGEIENMNENSLKVYFYNESVSDWEPVPDQGINTAGNYVWANVTHFSTYGLFGKELFCGDGVCSTEIGETCSSCPGDCGKCTGGSKSSGGTYTPPPETEEDEICEEDWKCTDWFDCFNDRQTRVCADRNLCGTEDNKPSEKQECIVVTISGRLDDCEMGDKACQDDDVYICSSEGKFLFMESCEYGCSEGECNVPESIGGILDFINGFFAGIFGGEAEGDSVTGFSVENTGFILAGAAIVVVLAGLALFFKFR